MGKMKRILSVLAAAVLAPAVAYAGTISYVGSSTVGKFVVKELRKKGVEYIIVDNSLKHVKEGLEDEEETTLKRFYNEGERIRLQPENRTMEPIYANPENVKIMGRVVTVIRQLA